VQKYEKGTNRLSVGRLQQLTDFLEVPMSYFFDDKQTGGSKLESCKAYCRTDAGNSRR
jgi:transcriptional regulator with XRE-family HTH domain